MWFRRTLPFTLETYLISNPGTVLTLYSNFNLKDQERGALGEV